MHILRARASRKICRVGKITEIVIFLTKISAQSLLFAHQVFLITSCICRLFSPHNSLSFSQQRSSRQYVITPTSSALCLLLSPTNHGVARQNLEILTREWSIYCVFTICMLGIGLRKTYGNLKEIKYFHNKFSVWGRWYNGGWVGHVLFSKYRKEKNM